MSSSSSPFGGETIQLSFGPAANAITSHLCNLQGLASTSAVSSNDDYYGGTSADGSGDNTSSSSPPPCDPYVTHAVQNEIYVPRVLFVDGRNNFTPWPAPAPAPAQDGNSNSNSNINTNTSINTNTNWEGAVEIHHRVPIYKNHDTNASANANTNTNVNNTNSSMNSNAQNHHFVDNSTAIYSSNQLNDTQRNAWNNFQQTIASSKLSTILNDGQHSRYHASKYQHVSSQYIYSSTSNNSNGNNGRYMQWDDDDEEEEEEEEEEEYYKQRKVQLERQKWVEREGEVQHDLDDAWNAFLAGGTGIGLGTDTSIGTNKDNGDGNNNNATGTNTNTYTNPLHYIQWFNYFMPPHPNEKMFTAPLPFDHIVNTTSSRESTATITTTTKTTAAATDQPILFSHNCGKYASSNTNTNSTATMDGITREWREEQLSDKIRKWMEDCDALRGVSIMVDNDMSFYGGLATSVLEELGDECRSAGKVSVLVYGGDDFGSLPSLRSQRGVGAGAGGTGGEGDNSSYWRSERKVVHSFRSHLNHGLNLHGIAENSDLVLPLSLYQCWKSLGRQRGASNKNNNNNSINKEMTLFDASAAGALALEAVTLPYRLLKQQSTGLQSSLSRGKRRSKMGIMSGYFQGLGQSDDNDAFPTADRLSYHEFISSLRPSNRHTILELSGLATNQSIDNQLMQGTSIERRKLEEERERNRNSMYYRRSRGRDIDPGLWIEDSGPNGGILCPLSPSPMKDQLTSRSMHRHFSMMTALRPKTTGSNVMTDQVSTYTTLIMEGMGIRYRPQSSVGTVLRQSIYDLTSSKSYAAGTYWKSIFDGQIQNVPVLTVLGNSTRAYSHLKTTASNTSQSLSRKYQGYLSRDSMGGIVPEREDCTDALEHIMDLRDTYEPPMMFDDEDHEGTYFEDNSE